MTTYHVFSQLAADRYNAAREGDALALATENVFAYLATEIEAGRMAADDDAAQRYAADFVADGYGYSVAELTA